MQGRCRSLPTWEGHLWVWSALLPVLAKRCCCEARRTSVDEAFSQSNQPGLQVRKGAGGRRRVAVSGQTWEDRSRSTLQVFACGAFAIVFYACKVSLAQRQTAAGNQGRDSCGPHRRRHVPRTDRRREQVASLGVAL